MKTLFIATLALIATAPLAFALNVTCAFTKECFDTEGCSDTSYETQIKGADGEPTVLSDVSGNKTGAMTLKDGSIAFTTGADSVETHLRVTAAGDARMVVIDMSVPYTIVYAGTCKAQ